MFSPHFSGDFEVIRKIYEMGNRYKVPIYAHAAGMNRYCGDPNYSAGEDPKVAYLLAAYIPVENYLTMLDEGTKWRI